jgi:hypothetical protein
MAAELGRHLEHDELIRARGKAAVAAEPVQLAGDREQRVIRRLVCEVIPLAALDAAGTAAPPEVGMGGSQQQFMQAGQGFFPLGGMASVAAGTGQAPEPLTRLLIENHDCCPPGGRALSQRHAQKSKRLTATPAPAT